ncbi:MAG: type II secretion system protein [Gammaproteobacteria bacterium]|nr:type II secretion system protein [Gammaproteobacteria bacterium]
MQKSQKGFTLIELVVVIVLLGILGVTALGKFQDISDQAQNAANTGVASELSAAGNINYATRLLTPTAGTAINTATEDCATFSPALFATGTIPSGYSITGAADCTDVTVDSVACTVNLTTNPSSVSGTAIVLCTN